MDDQSSESENSAKALVNVQESSLFHLDVSLPEEASKNVANLLCQLLGNVATDSTKVIGQIISDQFKAFRVLNLHWWNEKIKKRGIQVGALPPEFAIPMIESVADVSDETLQDMWASLLESAVEADVSPRVSFITLLKQLDPMDAKLLHRLALKPLLFVDEGTAAVQIENETDGVGFKISNEDLLLSIVRLERIGLCILLEGPDRPYQSKESRRGFGQTTAVKLTMYGKKVLEVFGVTVESECQGSLSPNPDYGQVIDELESQIQRNKDEATALIHDRTTLR
jgi:hypothetical protein